MSLSDFEILSKIGKGAYSTVFKVRRKDDREIYALKQVKMQNLNEKEKNNALNEVRILASIRHPSIISYKEAFFNEDGSLCLIMEYADNGDLFQKIVKHQKTGKYLSENFIWNVFIQVTHGLKALHDLNILHRDMKCANVFLNIDGSVKLGDMNVSKVAKDGLLYTQTGTPYYASPEVWQDKPYNNKSDIWSLGCVLYEAITLKPPFRADDMQGLYEQVIKVQYTPIQTYYSKDLRYVIKQLLQIDPSKRPNCDQILKMPPVYRRITGTHKIENLTTNTLLAEITISQDQELMPDGLPEPNYNRKYKSENSSLTKSPSKISKWEEHKSFIGKEYSYIEKNSKYYRPYRDMIKKSYGALQLPKIKCIGKQSPLPIRKVRDEKDGMHLPKSLSPNDRLKKLRDAYLAKSFKLYL